VKVALRHECPIVLHAVRDFYSPSTGVARASFEISGGFREGETGDCSSKFFDALTGIFGSYRGEYPMKMTLLADRRRDQTYGDLKRLLRGAQSELNAILPMITSCYAPIDGKKCNKCYKCRKIEEEKRGTSH
jgi:hypothetical protein